MDIFCIHSGIISYNNGVNIYFTVVGNSYKEIFVLQSYAHVTNLLINF